jgi:hypothetical protein
MPSIRTLTMIALMCAAVTIAAQTKTPLDAYKAYLDAASRATTPDTLFPFISKDFRGILEHAPKTEVAKMISGHIAKQKLTNIKVTSQKVEGSKAELQMTATTGDGRNSSGSATLLKEGGEWKLDEDAWATPTK